MKSAGLLLPVPTPSGAAVVVVVDTTGITGSGSCGVIMQLVADMANTAVKMKKST